MAGYIGARASVVSSGAERKQTYAITTTTTSLTGLAYTPTKVHVYHNGIRLVDGTDYTATDGSSITLTTAAENGDEVVVISYATFQTSDTVSAANGGTFAGNVEHTGTLTASGALNTGTILPSTDNASDLGSTSKRFQDLHLSGGVSFDEDPTLVTGSVTGKTLDDYEEGTWTPVIKFGGANVGQTYSIQDGNYTVIGRIVILSFNMQFSNKGTSTGGVTIDGSPFAQFQSRQFWGGQLIFEQGASSANNINNYVMPWSDGNLYCRYQNATTYTTLTDSNFNNNTQIFGTCIYQIS